MDPSHGLSNDSHPDDVAAPVHKLPAASGWRALFRRLLGLDLRSLAAFRIGLAAIILVDLAMRATDLVAHYTDAGVLPRGVLLQAFNHPYRFSFHFVFGEAWPTATLFGIQAVLAVFLLIGFHTRWMACLSWVLLVSMHNRNPLLLNAGDQLLSLLLFWGLFLPLGARWSIDSLYRPSNRAREKVNPHFSMATIALILQVCMVYLFTVLLKTGDSWWQGDALYLALEADLFATRWGVWLRQFGWLLKPLTLATLYWEMLGPLLVFLPWRNGVFRTLAVAGFVLLHVGIGLTMNVGIFPLVSIVGWIALLPGVFWQWVAECQSRVPIGLPSFHIERNGITQILQSYWPVSRDVRPPSAWWTWAMNVVVGLLLLLVIGWNIRTLAYDGFKKYFPTTLDPLAYALRLDQKWNMFAPTPMTDDGWYLVECELVNGDVVDLFREGQAATTEKPEMVLDTIPNRRWGKYLMRLKTSRYKHHRRHYARYLAKKWNREHDYWHQIMNLRFYFMLEKTTPFGPEAPRMIELHQYKPPQNFGGI